MAMQQGGRTRRPVSEASARFERDYRVFLEMQRQRKALDSLP
jgi:hypothetical protein